MAHPYFQGTRVRAQPKNARTVLIADIDPAIFGYGDVVAQWVIAQFEQVHSIPACSSTNTPKMERVPKVVGVIHDVGVDEPGATRTTPPTIALPMKSVPSELAARLSGKARSPGRVMAEAGPAADAPGVADPPMAVSPARPAKNERRKLMGRLRFRSSFARRVCAMRDKISRSTPAILASG
jgi:hypothetical protein